MNANIYLHDIECLKRVFQIVIIDYKTGDTLQTFEISRRRNDLEKIYTFYTGQTSKWYLIGFNSLHYDGILINKIIKDYKHLKKMSWSGVTATLRDFSDILIRDNPEDFELYRWLRYQPKWIENPYIGVDLFLYWSKMLRISKHLSLKSIACNLKWDWIQAMPIDQEKEDYEDWELDILQDYCVNDVLITRALAQKLKDEINLRVKIAEKYDLKCMSWDGVKIGLNVLGRIHEQRLGNDEFKKEKSLREWIKLKDIILPIVKFSKPKEKSEIKKDKDGVSYCNSFYDVWRDLLKRSIHAHNVSMLNYVVYYGSRKYLIRSGGLHSVHDNPEVIEPKEDEYYIDYDISSYYPSLGVEQQLVPEHLGKEFCETLRFVRDKRLESKAKGDKVTSEAFKLAMNGGFFGNTNQESSWMYDTACMLSITLNGQLLLCMLIEKLTEIGIRVDMANTDGITVLMKKQDKEKCEALIKEWEKATNLIFESVEYSKVVRRDGNNYIGVYKDPKKEPKLKGMFQISPKVGDKNDFLIIPIALHNYFVYGAPIEKTIEEHTDILDFCASPRIAKRFEIIHNEEALPQNINRYYVSRNSPYLYRRERGTSALHHIFKGHGILIYNKHSKENQEKAFEKVDKKYYICKANEIRDSFERKQLTLF